MKSYIKSLFSFKKVFWKNLSIFAYWDSLSVFTKKSEFRRFAKLKNSSLGRYSRINPYCNINLTTIANFTALGRGVQTNPGNHPMNYVSTHSVFYKRNNLNNKWVHPINVENKPISIGNDVWVGVDSLIMGGVKIGDGAVIGARSIVTKDIPPYAIAVGTPARVIKYRFTEEVIERLLKIQWWKLSDEEITSKINFFREPIMTIEIIDKYFPREINNNDI